jgi:hypothetical protein
VLKEKKGIKKKMGRKKKNPTLLQYSVACNAPHMHVTD